MTRKRQMLWLYLASFALIAGAVLLSPTAYLLDVGLFIAVVLVLIAQGIAQEPLDKHPRGGGS